MTKTLTIEDIVFYRNAEGDIRGDIDLRRDGTCCSESFGIYASGLQGKEGRLRIDNPRRW